MAGTGRDPWRGWTNQELVNYSLVRVLLSAPHALMSGCGDVDVGCGCGDVRMWGGGE